MNLKKKKKRESSRKSWIISLPHVIFIENYGSSLILDVDSSGIAIEALLENDYGSSPKEEPIVFSEPNSWPN